MKAIYRVKNNNETVGFILDDGNFYNMFNILNGISSISNIRKLSNGVVRANKSLKVVDYKQIRASILRDIIRENPFKRDIQKELIDWKNHDSSCVLQLFGARQIGKTTELLKFAYTHYDNVIYVNIAKDDFNFKELVIDRGSMPLYLNEYCLKANLLGYNNTCKTILILDEIQSDYKVYNSIRALRNNLRCDIVVTGSYLGILLDDKRFFLPAGTITQKTMYNISFGEFCSIFGCRDMLKNIDIYGKGDTISLNRLYELFDIYKTIGGYPAVIKRYLETKNVDKCFDVIENLLQIFASESRVYLNDRKKVDIFNSVYNEIMLEMIKEKRGSGNKIVEDLNLQFRTNLKQMLSRDDIIQAIKWVEACGIIGTIDFYPDGDPRKVERSRRIYYCDCGVANYIGIKSNIPESTLNGTLAENFVYTELMRLYKVRFSDRKVLYDNMAFSTLGVYELDFIVTSKNRKTYGIEVKNKSGKPNSLKEYIRRNKIGKGVVVKLTQGGNKGDFDTIPIWAVAERFPYET